MKSGEQCCKACHESHGSSGLDVLKYVLVCCLVSSAAKPAMNVAEVMMYKINRCLCHLGKHYIENSITVDGRSF